MADPSASVELPESVETLIEKICREQSLPPLGTPAKRELASLGEEESLKNLKIIRKSKIYKSLDGFIFYMAKKSRVGVPSPLSQSPQSQFASPASVASSSRGSDSNPSKCTRVIDFSDEIATRAQGPQIDSPLNEWVAGAQTSTPHSCALHELEFRKAFLVLNYIGRSKLEDVTSVDDIKLLQELQTMWAFESHVWNKFGQHFCDKKDRLKYLDWDSGRRYCYHCHVYPDGSCYFKGPFLSKTTTHLHKVVRDENVLVVKFAEEESQSSHLLGINFFAYLSIGVLAQLDIGVSLQPDNGVRAQLEYVQGSCNSCLFYGSSSSLDPHCSQLAQKGQLVNRFCSAWRPGFPSLDVLIVADWFEKGNLLTESVQHGDPISPLWIWGREEKKKNPSSSPVKCYFVDIESFAKVYANHLNIRSVNEARCLFMHIDNVSRLSNYMIRFSLILSKTVTLEVNMDTVLVEYIDDIPCQTAEGHNVYDIDGKLLIHTDGTGFISEDLALRCPRNCYKGSSERYSNVVQLGEKFPELSKSGPYEPPMLIQFRMFHDGRAIKGTVLVNRKLPPMTIQIRPSMIKVEADLKHSGAAIVNSFEIVGTSNKPKKTRLSKNLIALLNYGGVPEDFFVNILWNSLMDAQGVLSDKRAAVKLAVEHSEIDDDFTVGRMILSGIPLDEPFLQYRLSFFAKEERKGLKLGKLPIADSFYLMGTADPTGTLNSDEVCIFLENGQISGRVLVYRNPGCHFGDIHILNATYVKTLEDVVGNSKYGIFFSTKGPRSVADEIAGGDYDGDMYWVSRNPQLLQYFKPSEPWTCTYSSPKMDSPKKPTDFSAEELEHELFHLFLTARFEPSKSMSLAADSWLTYMDRLLTLGTNCAEERDLLKIKILRLIDIYYDALDAPKKGKKVVVPFELIPEKFPHHMERGEFRTYNSTSILGVIYDKVNEFREQELQIQVWKLPCFEVSVPEACLLLWKQHYKKYRSEMAEALCSVDESKHDSAAEVNLKYKQILYGADDLDKSPRAWEEVRAEALAIYHVTYDHAIEHELARYCGFAWKTAGQALLRIFVEEQNEKPVSCLPSVLREVDGLAYASNQLSQQRILKLFHRGFGYLDPSVEQSG
ncbi:hypothetical protein Nepgr_018365 [Nepenthes gracilis]|uniref:RNA-dependent RNA polymerase n=1 Tax=Nepenthes gracilis TaxID=150966 RepID=A0AAD3STA1_NEPGR|nr:hypothetical protein Nepgr_018365 [Nepenthes gracilis]